MFVRVHIVVDESRPNLAHRPFLVLVLVEVDIELLHS